jgi:hypothetical protein
MQAYVEQKLSGSSFVGGYLSGTHSYFDVRRLTLEDTKYCTAEVLIHMCLHAPRSNAFFSLTFLSSPGLFRCLFRTNPHYCLYVSSRIEVSDHFQKPRLQSFFEFGVDPVDHLFV